jgi:hypothetical protein
VILRNAAGITGDSAGTSGCDLFDQVPVGVVDQLRVVGRVRCGHDEITIVPTGACPRMNGSRHHQSE